MGDDMKKCLSDHDVQLFFDAAGNLLESAERDAEKAREATVALASFVNKMSAHLQRLEDNVSHKVNSSAETTANRAAELLSIKFQQANDAAKIATEQYQKATKNLNFRNWCYILVTQFILMLIFIGTIFFLAPPLDEIQQRRAELLSLNEQIKNLHLKWAYCEEDKKCFRTDEHANNGKPYINKHDGSTWRIPLKE